VDREDRVEFIPCQLRSGPPDPSTLSDRKGDENTRLYTVEARDRAGQVLERVTRTASFLVNADPRGIVPISSATIRAELGWTSGIHAVVISRKGRELARLIRSAHAPRGAFRDLSVTEKSVSFSLDVEDGDGDAVRCLLFLQLDNHGDLIWHGQLEPGEEGLKGNQDLAAVTREGPRFTLDRTLLSGAGDVRLRANFSDGINVTEAASPEFYLGAATLEIGAWWVDPRSDIDQPPVERLTEFPKAMLKVMVERNRGASIELVTGLFRITSDRDGPLHEGPFSDYVRPTYLSPGVHRVKVEVFDRKTRARLDEKTFLFRVDLEPEEWSRIRLPASLQPEPGSAGRIKDLIGKLGDPSATARDEAEAALGESGPMALPLIQEALGSPDPEVRARAAASFHRILMGWEERWDHIPPLAGRADGVIRRLKALRGDRGVLPQVLKRMLRVHAGDEAFWTRILGELTFLNLRYEILSVFGPEKYARIHRAWLASVEDRIRRDLPPGVERIEGPRVTRWKGGTGERVDPDTVDTEAVHSFRYRIRTDLRRGEALFHEILVDGMCSTPLQWSENEGGLSDQTPKAPPGFWPGSSPGDHLVELLIYDVAADDEITIYRTHGKVIRVREAAKNP
jgi:hypothetical protein